MGHRDSSIRSAPERIMVGSFFADLFYLVSIPIDTNTKLPFLNHNPIAIPINWDVKSTLNKGNIILISHNINPTLTCGQGNHISIAHNI